MTEDQPLLARRSAAIFAGDYVAVGAAHPQRHGADKHRAVRQGGLGDILEAGGIADTRRHCQCAQFVTI